MSLLRARRGSLAWLVAIAVLAVVLGVLVTMPLLRGDETGADGTLVGSPAPQISADDLAGRQWSLADGAGRITWVNFWATNCEPCRTEMPAMQRLADAYADRLLVLGVDWGESRAAVTDFVDRYAI